MICQADSMLNPRMKPGSLPNAVGRILNRVPNRNCRTSPNRKKGTAAVTMSTGRNMLMAMYDLRHAMRAPTKEPIMTDSSVVTPMSPIDHGIAALILSITRAG